jgi:hypothetical protein
MNEKIYLTDCTFIIPVKIDSEDREQNFRFVMKWFYEKFKTNIIITESSHNDDLVLKTDYSDVLEKNNATLIERPNEKYFKRTFYLNEMLKLAKTPITINYDIDVFMPINNYWEAKQKILQEGYDLVYPYSKGKFQLEVPQSYRDELLSKKEDFVKIDIKKLLLNESEYGHAQFFKTDTYKRGFGENEEFISFGPEDQERFYRFNTLGYKVGHLKDRYVFHLNHSRGRDSGYHLHYKNNVALWEKIKNFSKEDITKYYNKLKYTKFL